MKMIDIMLDLETMGKTANAPIMAIGACNFDIMTGEISGTFEVGVDLQSCLDMGMDVDASTIMWWLKQEPEARDKLIGMEVFYISEALSKLTSWLNKIAWGSIEARVWGNGATFDVTIIENAYKILNVAPPWKYYNIRDVRTIRDLCGGFIGKGEFNGVKHSPLADAIYQAKYVSNMWAQMHQALNLWCNEGSI